MATQIEITFPVIGPDIDGWFIDSPDAPVVQHGVERAWEAILQNELAPGQTGIIVLSIQHENVPYYLELCRGMNGSSDQYMLDIFASQAPTPTEKIKIIT